MYYLYGNTTNPMADMLSSGKSATQMMDLALKEGQSASDFAGGICPGMDAIHSEEWIARVDLFIGNMSEAVSAEYVWPYYKDMVHITFCGNIISALGPLFIVSMVLGLFCFPIFGLLAEMDLEEWLESEDHDHGADTDSEHASMMKT